VTKTGLIRLLGGYCLVALLAAAAGCPLAKVDHVKLQGAWRALLAGEYENAAGALKDLPQDSATLFLDASVQLSAGRLGPAAELASKLTERAPDLVEGRVLSRLIDRRKTEPQESWFHSFARAWQDEDSPPLEGGAVAQPRELAAYPALILPGAVRKAVRHSSSAILLAPELALTPRELLELCLAHRSGQMAPETDIVAFWFLWTLPDPPADMKAAVDERRVGLARELAAVWSEDMFFELRVALDEAMQSGHLNTETLDRLEAASCRPRLMIPRMELFTWYANRLREVGVDRVEVRAVNILGLLDVDHIVPRQLLRVVEASASDQRDLRLRLAGIEERVGAAYVRRGTIEHWYAGTSLLDAAARLRGDAGLQERAQVLRGYGVILHKLAGSAASAVRFWPVLPLSNEATVAMARNEISVYEELAGIGNVDVASVLLRETSTRTAGGSPRRCAKWEKGRGSGT
jgi:hypothetical protein